MKPNNRYRRHWIYHYRSLLPFAAAIGVMIFSSSIFTPNKFAAKFANTKHSGVTKKSNCNIKGNISYNQDRKTYHVPGQKDYKKTVISSHRGERWFCSEADARAEGWEKASR